MAFLEWRKFHFFDLKTKVDNGRIAELFKEDIKINTTSSGNNRVVVGDSTGQVHLISKSWNAVTFRAYELTTDFVYQPKSSSLLITIGQDEQGVNPLMKIWDTTRLDKNGTPHCFRVTRTLAGNKAVQVTCLCVHENLQLLAVGFLDGSLLLYRGDITRERNSKQKCLKDSCSAVTGLAFKSTSNSIYLFLATEGSVLVYNITQKDKEEKVHLDNIGCIKRCSVLAESIQESHFMVGRNDAVYCYTTDGRGPCYAIDGEKKILEWFRSYLIIISKSNKPTSVNSIPKENSQSHPLNDCITVLDIHNKFIVFSATVPRIKAVLNEFGAFFVIDEQNQVHHLDEKDLQSKLSLLFKKNLYDISIRIAKSQQYDADSLAEIFKQYGDHLCHKGDYVGAIEQYIKTIGKLEPSYVIRKFIDSQHIEKLTMYLESLHKEKQATEDHTTLLLNCYTKLSNTLGQNDGLKAFILSKDGDLGYDIDVAIKVCRHGSPTEALMLAKRHKKHDWYIKLLIEDHNKYLEVLDYISELPFNSAQLFMKKYGCILIQEIPDESTEFLKKLCTNYKPKDALMVSEDALSGKFELPQHAEPESFIHLFLKNSQRLVEFLEHVIDEGCVLTTPVYDTLLEHYLHVWDNSQPNDKSKWSQKIIKLLQNPDIKYDKSQALVVCHMHSYDDGILYLYEEQKLYQQILRHHIARHDANSMIACCRRFGSQDPTLWVQALWSCLKDTKNPSESLLSEILLVIAKERLLSPQLAIDALSSESADITVGHVKSYLQKELQQEKQKTSEVTGLIDNYRKDIDKLKKQLDNLRNGEVVIQGSRCAACHHPLELPTIHFLCQHSYHQHCFQSFCDEDQSCPACQPENFSLLEILKAREHGKDLIETFHSQLEKAHDGFSVAAEYFGRGVFSYNNINDIKRLIEEESSKIDREVGMLRPEPTNYGSSIKPRANKYDQKKDATSLNPFETDYDASNNPFGDDEDHVDGTNPFESGYDCDKNLNPFSRF